jgi:small-conductance mechanosensitive channel
MNSVRRIAADLGIALPGNADLAAIGVAAALAILGWGIGYLVGRWAGPPLADMWERRAGARTEGMAARMHDLIRYLIAAILLAIVANLYAWPAFAALIIGLALAAAVSLLIRQLVRGVQVARWIAALLAWAAFVAILADSIGGLTEITGLLDRVGFSLGDRRFSLLTVFQIFVALVTLYVVVRLINRVVGHSIKRASGLDATQQLLAQKLAGIIVLVIAFFVGIDLIGIDLTALAVFSGALGLAVGFGLQKTFGNLIAGIILLMDRSIKPGDVIAVGDSFGAVNKIGVRAVSIVTREGKEHLIPNEILMTEEVVNWSYSSRDVRIAIPVGISYNSDMALAERLMTEATTSIDRVLKSPGPKVWMRGFGESSVDFEVRVWIRDPEEGVAAIKSAILKKLWVLFKENGIELPFPQRDIRVKELPPLKPE